MTLLTVRHTTTYRYKQPVAFGEHRMMLRPRDSYDQKLLEAWLTIEPEPAQMRWVHDVFGNCVAIAEFGEAPSKVLRFESTIWLDHSPSNAPDAEIEDYARQYPFAYAPDELADLAPAMIPQYPDPGGAIRSWVRQILHEDGAPHSATHIGTHTGTDTGIDTGRLLLSLTYAFKEAFTYERRSEPGTRPPADTLRLKRGSCRDLALLMIEALRSLGFAARFVSGYLYVPSSDGPSHGAGHVGGGSTHAWCEVYLPGAGWVEFDPTNAIVGNRDLIRVAVARDPSQAIPLSGTYFGCAADFLDMTVEVKVRSEPGLLDPSAAAHAP